MKSLRAVAALTCAGLISACSFAPKYERPDLNMPGNFAVDSTTAAADSIADRWWTAFGDETLNALVEEALVNNQDLAAAAARVEQARAIAGQTSVIDADTLDRSCVN